MHQPVRRSSRTMSDALPCCPHPHSLCSRAAATDGRAGGKLHLGCDSRGLLRQVGQGAVVNGRAAAVAGMLAASTAHAGRRCGAWCPALALTARPCCAPAATGRLPPTLMLDLALHCPCPAPAPAAGCRCRRGRASRRASRRPPLTCQSPSYWCVLSCSGLLRCIVPACGPRSRLPSPALPKRQKAVLQGAAKVYCAHCALA